MKEQGRLFKIIIWSVGFFFQMFCTPNFGDDDFDLNLLDQSKELCFNLNSGNHSNLGIISGYWPSAAQNLLCSQMDPPATSQQSSFSRSSILESLESIAPKFPPQEDLDIPDISVTNSLNSNVGGSQSIFSSGFSTSQMYSKQNGQTSLSSMVKNQKTEFPNQISPAPSTNSTLSPRRESSEDSDDSVPLAQVKHQACCG